MRDLDRLIVRLERDGISVGLAQAYLERAELLMEQEEFDEGLAQVNTLVTTLEPLEGAEVRLLRARALVCRARFHHSYGQGLDAALEDLDQALHTLRVGEEEELRVLRVELWILRGHLQLVSDEDGAADLERAVQLARSLEGPRAQLLLLSARRELAVALAQHDVEAGLRELGRAEEAARSGELPETDAHLLRSTRAELLANAGRLPEALALLMNEEEDQAPDWMLAQRAVTYDMAGRSEDALESGAELVARRSERLDTSSTRSYYALGEALLAQAQRLGNREERIGVILRCRRLLEEIHGPLSLDALRLLTQALEMLAGCVPSPDEVHEALATRVGILEALVRDLGTRQDRIELIRGYLQLGDVLMELGQPLDARHYYLWARRELERFEPEDRVVLSLLPLALHAQGNALGAAGQWLAAKRSLDEAVRCLGARTRPEALVRFADVFMFRALTHVSVGDPKGAVVCLREDVARLLGGILRDGTRPASSDLLETAVDLYILQAEILVDHLEDTDRSVEAYDQALQLCELGGGPPEAKASLLGAKGALLNEAGRSEDALPVLQECLRLFLEARPESAEGNGDVALARVNIAASLSGIGKPRDALNEIGRAYALLRDVDGLDYPDVLRYDAIRTHLYMQRGEALVGVGHPLLAADEFTHSIDICESLLDEDGDAQYEARLRLPLALLHRARCWVDSGDHSSEATKDLRKAYRLYAGLFEAEARPEHRRRLGEVRQLQRKLSGGGGS